MNLNFLYENSGIILSKPYEKKHSWFEWFHLRRRKPNSNEEINEIHDLILNVYESMDDQVRAVLLSLSRTIQDEDKSITIEQKVKAIVAIGHSICCGHLRIKNATQLYTKLLVRTLSHSDIRMCLASMIAISEIAIDNLDFQMKLNEMEIIPKLFEIMKNSIPYAGRTLYDINEFSKLVAWCCYTIVNSCVNCMPNILLLRDVVARERNTLNDAVQMEIWLYVWRENYAQTILQFADRELTSDIMNRAIQPSSYPFDRERIHAKSTSVKHSVNHVSPSINYQRCTVL